MSLENIKDEIEQRKIYLLRKIPQECQEKETFNKRGRNEESNV